MCRAMPPACRSARAAPASPPASISGQLGAEEFEGWRLSPGLKARLKPFIGLRGAEALAMLARAPLLLSGADVLELDAVVRGRQVARLRDAYNAVTLPIEAPGFDEIPPAARTVMASVAFQYGDLAHRCPRFWRCCIAQGWHEAAAELDAFGDVYPTRRRKEAAYLRAGIAPAV
jgi:hypothetical protein